MTSTYGQYCPVSLATEILGERWTMLVVLALSNGAARFNDLQRAMPRISASTLAQRLRSLEASDVISKRRVHGGTTEYRLTEAGEALAPIVLELGYWGQRWARDLVRDDLDPRHLMWNVHNRMNVAAMPPGRTTLRFEFTDMPAEQRFYWIVVNDGQVDVCLKDPGYETDVYIRSAVQRFVDAWRGFRCLRDEVVAGRIEVTGPPALVRAFPGWLLLSAAAHIERERPGRERALWRRTAARR